jgi:thioesterase domain-containing protein
VAPFAPVVRRLEARWEAIGVLDPALFDEEPPIARIEDLAARMAAAVRSVDPEGPWILAGYSAGARAVHEMARILRAEGGAAGCVILDAGPGNRSLSGAALRVAHMLKRQGRMAARAVSDRIAAASGKAVGVEAERRRYRRISDVQHGRLLRHWTRPSDAPVALVRAASQNSSTRGEDYGWAKAAQLLGVFVTPGDHFNCFMNDNVPAFAETLERGLLAVSAALCHERAS